MSSLIKKLRRGQTKNSADQKFVLPVAGALKEKAILLGWITGVLLLISLLWILTSPLQSRYLLRTINTVLISNNDSRRVQSNFKIKPDKADLLGYWFLMYNSTDKMFVFTVFQDGILIPLGAVISDNGDINDVIPLSAHAAQIFNKLPDSVLKIYTQRIQAAYLSAKPPAQAGRQK